VNPSEYSFERGGFVKRRVLQGTGLTVGFRAENLRPERTGIHAKVYVLGNTTVLAWSNFNVERDEDRVRLANSAYKHIEGNKNGLKDFYPSNHLKADLDEFCLGLWEAQIGRQAAEMVNGSTERHPPKFLLRPFVLEGGGTIVFAPPGRGKSYTLMLMGISLDAGVQTLWPVQQRRVLLINLERSPQSVADRLGNINEVLGLDRKRPLYILNARGRALFDVLAAAERAIDERHIDVVLLDSISRAGLGDLNDNQAVNRIIDALNDLAPTWLALAHTPRSDETHVYGGIHFEAGADVVVQLLSEQKAMGPLGIGLDITKNNDIGKASRWVSALEFDASGLVGVRQAGPGEFQKIEGGKDLSMRDAVREYLLDVGPQSAGDIARELGFNRSNVAFLLSSDKEAFERGGLLGGKRLYRAVE